MTMTREEAIRNYVKNLTGDDLAYLLQCMHGYDGCFGESTYYDMDSFDEFMYDNTPSEIARMIHYGDFNPNDDFFRFDGYGNLESADGDDVVAEAEDLKEDIVDHLVNYYRGDTPWRDLDTLVDAEATAIFDEDFEEVYEDDDDE